MENSIHVNIFITWLCLYIRIKGLISPSQQ